VRPRAELSKSLVPDISQSGFVFKRVNISGWKLIQVRGGFAHDMIFDVAGKMFYLVIYPNLSYCAPMLQIVKK
jgi:hypothetical protein